jgi:hypothetical protein
MRLSLAPSIMLVAGATQPLAAHTPEDTAVTAQPHWTILPEGEAQWFIHPCSRRTAEGLSGAWTPSAAEVARAEASLEAEITSATSKLRQDRRSRTPKGYYRQYGGILLRGQRVIYVHGIAESLIDRRPHVFRTWRKKIPRVCDFGTDAFGAIYDPSKAAFTSFEFDFGY